MKHTSQHALPSVVHSHQAGAMQVVLPGFQDEGVRSFSSFTFKCSLVAVPSQDLVTMLCKIQVVTWTGYVIT